MKVKLKGNFRQPQKINDSFIFKFFKYFANERIHSIFDNACNTGRSKCFIKQFLIFPIFFFQAEDGIRGGRVTGVQTCALPISWPGRRGKAMNSAACSSHAARRSAAARRVRPVGGRGSLATGATIAPRAATALRGEALRDRGDRKSVV